MTRGNFLQENRFCGDNLQEMTNPFSEENKTGKETQRMVKVNLCTIYAPRIDENYTYTGLWKRMFWLGGENKNRAKQNSPFEHSQKVRIYIILRIRKCLCSPFIHPVESNDSVSGQ